MGSGTDKTAGVVAKVNRPKPRPAKKAKAGKAVASTTKKRG